MANNATEKAVQSDLLECPFCGPVEIVHRWADNVEIKHKPACFLHAITTLHGGPHIAAWNRRYSNAAASQRGVGGETAGWATRSEKLDARSLVNEKV